MTRNPTAKRSSDHAVDARLQMRRRLLGFSMGMAALLIIGRGVQLQGFEGEKWARIAADQQQTRAPLPARRGAIFDRDGVPLALTRETYRISVAPREVRDRGRTVGQLVRVLGISRAAAQRATQPRRRWVTLSGRYTAEQRRSLEDLRGLHFERKLERFYPQGDVGREVLGGVSGDDRALGGMEQAMDGVLRGEDGYSVLRRNAGGRAESSMSLPVAPPRDGSDVFLTLDFDLQEIADAALAESVRETGAAGGDLLLADPRTGEILAAVSQRTGGARGLGAFIEPYEPGSTLKPFFVASLLAGGHATLGERVYAENGRWKDPVGRVHTDVHPYEWLTLRDALRVSSNIGMVKFVSRVRPAEQFRALRDFGFGTPTGVEYPTEASGRLPRPSRWSRMTPASLAVGYEVAVTPIQLTMAYGALANGGTLMEPRLLREVRAAGGGTIRSVQPRAVRRVLSPEVTHQLRDVLVSVVADGTATRASLATFEVAGKTGTSRRTGAGGRYEAGSYTATFVGFFPARDPQLTIFVKLDRPKGEYYGGLTAAPVTRTTLQAILATRSPSLDGRSLLATRLHSDERVRPARSPVRSAPRSGSEGAYVFVHDQAPVQLRTASAAPAVLVPDLTGLPLRDAARRLHALGFGVRLRGSGVVEVTQPSAGGSLPRGSAVLLVGEDG